MIATACSVFEKWQAPGYLRRPLRKDGMWDMVKFSAKKRTRFQTSYAKA
jgi:hypothetical protein